jgi:hypothetical protein
MPVKEKLAIIEKGEDGEIIQMLFAEMSPEKQLEMLKGVPVEKRRQLLKMLQQMFLEEMTPSSELQDEKKRRK